MIEDAIKKGTKTIVFSLFTELLSFIEAQLIQDKTTFGRYDGGMSASTRDGAVRKFTKESDCDLLLVSLKAGNCGLNVVLTPVILQAVDRAHRIGQK